jgi:hypothetical protein
MELVQTTKEATVFRMSDGNLRPILHAPGTPEAARSIEIFVDARSAVLRLEDARRAIVNNQHLTEAGKIDQLAKLEPMRQQMESEFLAAKLKLDEHAKSVEAAMAKALAPPPIPKDDLAAVSVDRELRDWARTARGEQQSELLQQIAEGGVLATAIMRQPIGVPRLLVDAAATAHRAQALAGELGLQALGLQAGVDWARQSFATLSPYVAGAAQPLVRRPAA